MSKDNSDYKKSFLKPGSKGNDTVLKDLPQKVANASEGALKQQSSKKKNKK